MSTSYGTGWLRDIPDIRDYSDSQHQISRLRKRWPEYHELENNLPNKICLRKWCSPIEDQGALQSCTAQAGVALVEFFERLRYGKHIDGSRLFLYKATRNLAEKNTDCHGDTGATIRGTMKAMVHFGIPPERSWPYVTKRFDKEPPAFCYAYAQQYQAIKYYRVDMDDKSDFGLLPRIKHNLASFIPMMFGFTTYSSIEQATETGKIPFPSRHEKAESGHAVVAVGYDDDISITNEHDKKARKGALKIRNSWGKDWGDGGYGWLPYEYVERRLTADWWSLIKNEWVEDEFAFDESSRNSVPSKFANVANRRLSKTNVR